jgi:hypothetical protein
MTSASTATTAWPTRAHLRPMKGRLRPPLFCVPAGAKVIPAILLMHRRNPVARIGGCGEGRFAAGKSPSGNGKVVFRRWSPRSGGPSQEGMQQSDWPGACKEEARGGGLGRSRTHFPSGVQRNRSLRAMEPRREDIEVRFDEDPSGDRAKFASQRTRKGTDQGSGPGSEPGNRPGPKGLGRNPISKEPGPHRPGIDGRVGAGGNASPHCYVRPVRCTGSQPPT